MSRNFSNIQAIEWKDNTLRLLDQRLLPSRIEHLELNTAVETAKAIREMVVRGAPAIGITAAYGVVLSVIKHTNHSSENWMESVNHDLEILAAARPTAVNLVWAIERMKKVLEKVDSKNAVEILLQEARSIHQEDIEANQRMGELGAALIEQPCSVLTHCNAGALATGGYGTALGVIRSAWSRDMIDVVYADETRPWFQGSRLTAWELGQDHIPVKLIADSAAAYLMKTGKVGWVIVGSDRIAANGDVANKIGTYSAAVSAKYHGVKFMVVAPSTTVDMSLASGDDIPIEMRNPEEILSYKHDRIAAEGVDAWNPVFDVTPAELVDAIVTEKGVVLAPDLKKMQSMMAVESA